LQFKDGENAQSLSLTGKETFAITGLDGGDAKSAHVVATSKDGKKTEFDVHVMLLTPKERDFYKHGGILQYVLRDLAKAAEGRACWCCPRAAGSDQRPLHSRAAFRRRYGGVTRRSAGRLCPSVLRTAALRRPAGSPRRSRLAGWVRCCSRTASWMAS